METGAFGNTISDKATEYLRPSIEGKPYSNTRALLFLSVPLFCVRLATKQKLKDCT